MLVRSVSFRLIVLSMTWIAAALIVGGLVLAAHFRAHVERSFDAELLRHIQELLTVTEVRDGQVVLTQRPVDPRYARPLSGWYWQVQVGDEVVARSRSLWDEVLSLKMVPERGDMHLGALDGPRNQTLRVMAQSFAISGAKGPVTITFTGPIGDTEFAVHEFSETLRTSLIVLGLGLGLAVVVQVWLGLRPLGHVRRSLADVHAGRTARMTGTYPSEVEPLVDDLNQLLDHNTEVIARARTHAGNLAHALKTPLAVLGNEADKIDGESGAVVKAQVAMMNDQVTRHLTRARASGGLGVPGAHTDVEDVAQGLGRTLEKIYADKGVCVRVDGLASLCVATERQDLEEMLGNLMDNACKWARSEVVVAGRRDGRDVELTVADDGPGIPEGLRDAALGRGERLDETTPGSGLGLSIVRELAGLNHGELRLKTAKTGGLLACLRLPAG